MVIKKTNFITLELVFLFTNQYNLQYTLCQILQNLNYKRINKKKKNEDIKIRNVKFRKTLYRKQLFQELLKI